MQGIDDRTRAAARAAFRECMEEAVYFESAKADKRARALVAMGLVVVGLGMGLMGSAAAAAPSAAGPVAVERTVPGTDTWTPDGISDFVRSLNQQIQADQRFDGKVVVVDTGLGSEGAMVDMGMEAVLNSDAAQQRMAAGTLDYADVESAMERLNLGTATSNGKEASDEGYFCFAAGVTADEMTKDFMGIMSRAGDRVEFADHVSSETAHKITIAHELGHCLNGIVKISDDALFNRMWNEHTADAFAALFHIKTGGAAADVAKLADLRDLRLGFAPSTEADNPAAYNVSHDTGPLLRAIAAAAPEMLKDGALDGMSLGDLVDLGQRFAKDTFPSYEEFQARSAAFHTVKSLNQGAQAADLGAAEAAAVARFDAAFKSLTGKAESPVSVLVARHAPSAPPRDALRDEVVIAPEAFVSARGGEARPWLATRTEAERRLEADIAALVRADEPLLDGLNGFARRAAAIGLPPREAAAIALEEKAVSGALPGFRALGIDSPGRRQAKEAFAAGFAKAVGDYAAAAQPLRIPAHPAATHEVRVRPDLVTVHRRKESGTDPIDNPIDAAMVVRGKGEFHFRDGQRVPSPPAHERTAGPGSRA